MQWRLLVGISVAALLPECEAQTYPEGCFLQGVRFTPVAPGASAVRNTANPFDCQTECARNARCKYFGYDSASGACRLSEASVRAVPGGSFVSGPASCRDGWGGDSPCTALPGPGFPGATANESLEAWPMSFVPPKFQCWPHGGTTGGDLLPCGDGATRVLEDTASGWPGKCLGLVEVALPPGVSCRRRCEQDLMCPSWQEVDEGGNRTSCWHGLGHDCWDANRNLAVRAAQRLMRGSHRVLMSLAGYEVDDLRLVFDASMFGRNLPVAKTACQRACLSLLSCEVWQYSNKTGCWVNDPSYRPMPYPPTAATFRSGTEAAKYFVAGEYLQHLCKAGGARAAAEPRASAVDTSSGALAAVAAAALGQGPNLLGEPGAPASAHAQLPSPALPAAATAAREAAPLEQQGAGASKGPTVATAVPSERPQAATSSSPSTSAAERTTTTAVPVAAPAPPPLVGPAVGSASRSVQPADLSGLAVQLPTAPPATTAAPPTSTTTAALQPATSADASSALFYGLPWYVWAALILVPCCMGCGLAALVARQSGGGDSKRRGTLDSSDSEDAEADHVAEDGWSDSASSDWQARKEAGQHAGWPGAPMLPVAQGLPGLGSGPYATPPRSRGVGVPGLGGGPLSPSPPLPPPLGSPGHPARKSMLSVDGTGSPGVPPPLELDLVRVTEHGVEITPLEGPLPPGVQVLSPVPN